MKMKIVLLLPALLFFASADASVAGHEPERPAPEQRQNRDSNRDHGRRSFLGRGYAKDNWNVYYKGVVVKDAVPFSFEYVGKGYAKDNKNVYYKGVVVKDAVPFSFEYLGMGYAKDNWNVFYKGNIIECASAISFRYLQDGYATDAWSLFYKGRKRGAGY